MFKDKLQALVNEHYKDATPDDRAAMVAHLNAAAKATSDAYGSASGHNYVVFPDESDPDYGNPFGGSSPDDGA